jgi:hypothetical protein
VRFLARRGGIRRLRQLDEAEAYARCHGDRPTDVRVVRLEPRGPRDRHVLSSGEILRQAFEQRLDARESASA